MTEPVKRSIKKSLRVPAWAGDLGEVRKVVDILESSAIRRRDAELMAFDVAHTDDWVRGEAEARERAAQAEDPDWYKHRHAVKDFTEELIESRANRRSTIESRWRVTLEVVDGDNAVEGPPAAIFSEIDRRSVRRIVANASREPFSSDMVQVKFDDQDGVRIDVSSTDPAWGRQVFASLAEEVEKGRPRWAWINSTIGSSVGVGISFALIYLLLIVFTLPLVRPSYTAGLLFAIIAALLALGIWTTRIQHWFFPSFDVVADGSQPRGTRRWIALAGWLATILIGTLINLVT